MFLENFKDGTGWYIAVQEEPHGQIALYPKSFKTEEEAVDMIQEAMKLYLRNINHMWKITITKEPSKH